MVFSNEHPLSDGDSESTDPSKRTKVIIRFERCIHWGIWTSTGALIISAWLIIIITMYSVGSSFWFGIICPTNNNTSKSSSDTFHVLDEYYYKSKKSTTGKKNKKVLEGENRKSHPSKSGETQIKANFTLTILEAIDRILIALTVFFSGYLLLSMLHGLEPAKLEVKKGQALADVLKELKKAIDSIDKSILSMVTITLVLTFLVCVLREEHGSTDSGASLLNKGMGMGIIILVAAIYIYLTHDRDQNK